MRDRLLRALPILAGLALLWPSRIPASRGMDVQGFSRLPVLDGGRVKPMDSAARTALLLLHGRQSLAADGRSLSASEWLLDALARPEAADLYRSFRVEDPDLLGLLGRDLKGGKHLSFMELEPALPAVAAQAARAGKLEAAQRGRFEAAVVNLQERLDLYMALKNSLQVEGTRDLPEEIRLYRLVVPEGVRAVTSHMGGGRFDRSALQALGLHFERYRFLASAARLRPLPPLAGEGAADWRPVGQALLEEMRGFEPHPAVMSFALMAKAWREGDAAAFNGALAAHEERLAKDAPAAWRWSRAEAHFDRAEPFARGLILYLAVFLLFLASWAAKPAALRRTGRDLLYLAFAVHTTGLAARMLLQGRPPVTNLYSSAVFVGWVAALLGIVLERRYRNGFGGLVASAAGFATLIIAHNLQGQGDTLEVMRAVLDSNFWLSTHVVCITMGYGAMFLASGLAHAWILRNLKRERGTSDDRHLVAMTYGIVCAALLFSFVGTILGGIWADQSWGRFWGWDPKENGALLIVLWNAVVLHARWGGFIRDRGLMVMAVCGGIVTSLSWFGVNMLGIGLHSYGFMDKAFYALSAFIAAQLLVMAAAALLPRLRPA